MRTTRRAVGRSTCRRTPSDTYGSRIYSADPNFFWRLNETAGSAAKDEMGASDGAYTGGVTLGDSGAVAGNTGDHAPVFDGVNGNVATAAPIAGPTVYSEELWFNTTTTSGGKLIGFGSAQTGNSGSYDRHVWMLDNGQLRFGVWTGATNIVETPDVLQRREVAPHGGHPGRRRHEALRGRRARRAPTRRPMPRPTPATGASVATPTGADASSTWFAGKLDEVAVYSRVLSPSEVSSHYTANGGAAANRSPVAAFTSSAVNLVASFDGSGSADPDGTVASYAWKFGDGSTGTGVSPSHTYAAAGTFQVELTVTDDKGATNAVTKSVTVCGGEQSPVAAFTSSAVNSGGEL